MAVAQYLRAIPLFSGPFLPGKNSLDRLCALNKYLLNGALILILLTHPAGHLEALFITQKNKRGD